MGEAKRKKREHEDRVSRVQAARYRPVDTVLAIRRDSAETEAEHDARVRALADLARLPNALRPRGWEAAGNGASLAIVGAVRHALDGGRGYAVLDREGRFLRRMPAVEFGGAYHPTDLDGAMHYAETGDEVELRATLRDGFVAPDGKPAEDFRALVSGLARFDPMGGYVVAADAPLTLQAAAIRRMMAGEEDAAVLAGLTDHMHHVIALAKAVQRLPRREPDAMLDLGGFNALIDDTIESGYKEGDVVDPAVACRALLAAYDGARRDGPSWTVGSSMSVDPASWVSRDTPAAGADWTRLHRAMRRLPWVGEPIMPNADAQFIIVPRQWPEIVKQARAALTGQVLVTDGDSSVVHDVERRLHIAWLERSRSGILVAWPDVPSGVGRTDPLMAENLVGWCESPPGTSDVERREFDEASYSDWMESFALLALHDILPEPDHQPFHAPFLFLTEHRRFHGIPDLLASLAEVVREGRADAAFRPTGAEGGDVPVPGAALSPEAEKARESFVARALSLGGEARDTLVALFRFIEPENWDGVDLDADMTVLRDGMRAGMTLEDLAVVTMTNMRGIELPKDEDEE